MFPYQMNEETFYKQLFYLQNIKINYFSFGKKFLTRTVQN
ncbi:hypothetical protein FFONT_0724 [Fervidicoccus fontis Kam940]|uniref:Uncharacterized protein n=1 Tax=Fervidicoccus fontis (strain DSM 19380 / JCM 18336 / VKM B-2539 / Kam940) TaxID=1163730 RepID=I0A155_FERFK|nr:hypothetical protein FFONT_0724 [Fervidicoccus fontis Kam940]